MDKLSQTEVEELLEVKGVAELQLLQSIDFFLSLLLSLSPSLPLSL